MNTEEAIRKRASVRSYGSAKVSDAVIKELIELACQAPSAGNVQEWRFVVVKDRERKARLAESYIINRKAQFEAPVIVVVCADLEAIDKAYGERGISLYAPQDIGAAVQTFMLAAVDRGLGTCWIGAFNEQIVKNAMVLPENLRPMAMITLGYAKDNPKKPPRKALSEIACAEVYGKVLE
jgi:nitroreductase